MTEEKNFDTYPCCANCVHYDSELEVVDLPGLGLHLQQRSLAPLDAVARQSISVAVPMVKGACREAQTGAQHVKPGNRCGRHPFLAVMVVSLCNEPNPPEVFAQYWTRYLVSTRNLQALVAGKLEPKEAKG